MISSAMKNSSKEIGNMNISGRLKQIFVLVVAILIGMIISATTADAKDYQRQNQKKNKAIYKKQNQVLAKACHLLQVKRNHSDNVVVKDRSKLKYR